MKLSEIIALSKAGFKANEIRQMIADDDDDDQVNDPGPDPDDNTASGAEDDQPENIDDDEGTADQEPAGPEPDYKKLYLEEKANREKAHEKNVRTEQPDLPDDNEIIKNLVNEFL